MRLFSLFVFLLAFAAPVLAQPGYDAARMAELIPVGGPQRNIVDNLHAEGDTLWAGQQLTFTPDGGQSWLFVEDPALTPPIAPNAIAFSIDVEGDDVWVGLGFSDASIASRPQSTAGFAYSNDGGDSWRYFFPQLDQPEDTTAVYGVSVLPALPVIVPQQSPPFDIDFDPVTRDVWVAGWASGIRRLEWLEEEDRYAADFERVILPPDTLDAITPIQPYNFVYAPEIQDAEEGNNFLGFSVLVDETGTVWAGTVAGVNRSRPEDVFTLVLSDSTGMPIDTLVDRAWTRTGFDGTSAGLPGNWVIAIEEQPIGDDAFEVGTPENPRNPVWLAVWRAREEGERFALVVTRDGGETFEPALVGGGRFYDVAFCPDAATYCTPSTVYAAGADGLFISEDDGQTWRSVRDFQDRDPDRPGRFVSRDANAFAVATTAEGLWVGTGDGLIKSTDGGATWTIFRTDVPTNPETPTDDVPDVEAYAYPNPFSPSADRYVRIRYDRPGASIRIFDFGMNLVRSIPDAAPTEQVWDGFDDDGNRVANGVYFYEVDAGGESLTGKILVLE